MEQTQQENARPSAISAQQLSKDLVEIFKLRATSLFLNTLVLYWPIVALVVFYYLATVVGGLWEPFASVAPFVYILLVGVFIFYSMPRINLDRVEKRFWIRRYFAKRQVVSREESHNFIYENKGRILAYHRLIFKKIYLAPLIVTFIPIIVVAAYIALGVTSDSGGQVFAYVFLGSLVGIPLLITIFLFYWLHTRTTLMYAWERFVDAVDSKEDISNEQILNDARRLVKLLGFKGRAKFVSYDFAMSTSVGLPAVAVTQAARLAPQPVEKAISTFALLYTFNAYQLENLAIVYCFYTESRVKDPKDFVAE